MRMMRQLSFRFAKKFLILFFIFCFPVVYCQQSNLGLTKTETPVPFGKLTYVVGYGWEGEDIDLRLLRIPDEKYNFPSNTSMNTLLKKGGEKVEVIQKAENTLTILLPEKKFGVGVFFFDNERDISKSLVINAARLDWLSTDEAFAGDTVRAFGRGLVNIDLYPERDSQGKPVSHAGYINSDAKMAMKDSKGKFHWIDLVKTSSYDIHFIIPAKVAEGVAQIYCHNGHGGQFGWSEPQELVIKKRNEWPSQVFNVLDYGAKGDSYTDDSKAIKKALHAVRENGGGILYFPRGGYHFNFTMRVPDKTVIRGEDRANTWLYLPDGYHTNARDTTVKLAIAGEGSLGVENLSIHAVYVNMVIAAPVQEKLPESWSEFQAQDWSQTKKADYSFVKNCRIWHNFTHLYHRRFGDPSFDWETDYLQHEFEHHGKAVNVILKGNNVEVSGSEFQGKGSCVYLVDCNFTKISDNLMHSGHRSNCISIQHGSSGYENIILEDNEFRAFATTHHAALYMMYGGCNMYLARNKIVSQFWVSDNEGMLGHIWGYHFPMYIKDVEGKKIILNEQRIEQYWDSAKTVVSNWLHPFTSTDFEIDYSVFKGKEVQVYRGQGLGQNNFIEKVEGSTIYLKDELKTPLTAKSLLVAHDYNLYRNMVFADNDIADCGQAIFFWGHAHDIIIDGNKTARTGIIGAWSVLYAGNIAGACHFFQIINNFTDDGRARVINHHDPGGRYMGGGIGNHYSCPSPYPVSSGGALNYVGYIVRNNLLKNDCMINYMGYDDSFCQEGFEKAGQYEEMPYDHLGFIFEDNKHHSCKYGMALGRSVKAVVRNIDFQDVDVELFKTNGAEIIEMRK